MAFMTKYEIFVTYISPAITIIIASLNIFFVYLVFKFNRKMGQSKLSIKPSLELESSIPKEQRELYDTTYHLFYLAWLNKVRGLPNMTLEDLMISGKKILSVNLINKGELASTNIKVILIFKAYGTKLRDEFSSIEQKITNEKIALRQPMSSVLERKCVYSKKIVIKVPYIGADDNKVFSIAPLREQFRETELILVKIEANGHTYFKRKLLQRFFKPVVINHYMHPFLQMTRDPKKLKQLMGADNPDKEIFDPYRLKGGHYRWLLKLFAGWRK